MINLQDHETEVRELFEAVTVEYQGLLESPVRLITLEGFQKAVERMMNKAYYYGADEGLKRAEHIIEEAFSTT